MGAWGLGLFQSDHDYDHIGNFGGEAKIFKIEEAAVEEAVAQGKKVAMKCDLDRFLEPKVQEIEKSYNEEADKNAKKLHKKGKAMAELETVEIHYSIYGRHCSDIEKIRQHLDSGILFRMLAKAQKKLKASYGGGYDEDGYCFILLGACGMSLGCRLPDSTLTLMRRHYKNVGLMRDAKKQMEKALDEDNGYANGTPWDFGSLGRRETLESGNFAPMEDRLHPPLINVQEPGADAAPKSAKDAERKLAEQMNLLNLREESKFNKNACGDCGATEGKDGAKLLQCAKCKMRKYCSKECQSKHRQYHKLFCKYYAEAEDGKAHLSVIATG